nr:putative ribonuclease H-like domain-containing protein [Tanacetum cinerariifolium]
MKPQNLLANGRIEDCQGGNKCVLGCDKGKGEIRTGKLDFDDVYFVKDLKFNLFRVSQMCDKKNIFLFTYTKCIVLSSDFKLPDENHALLRVPRENNVLGHINLKTMNKLVKERKYPLIRFTLDQMLNAVRLEVEEESEVSLELLSFGVDAAKEFKEKHAKCLMLLVKDLVLPSKDDDVD